MNIYYLFLKILYKLKAGSLFYFLLRKLNILFTKYTKLPSINESRKILSINRSISDINNNNKTNHLYTNNKYYDLQIIVPTYNSQKYINKCLDSIISQKTEYNFQVLVINDGSTDDTYNLLKKYEYNPLIQIINEKNLGRSGARDTGLKSINSEYIMFVDSDDQLPENCIQKLLSIAYKFNSDNVFGGYYNISSSGKIINKVYVPSCKNVYMRSSKDSIGYLWGQVFKSSLFKNVLFPLNYEFEDTIVPFWIYPKCKRITSVNSCVYYYRNNPNSISNNIKFNKKSIDSFLITDLIIKELLKKGITINQYVYNTFLLQVKINCLRNIYLNVNIQKSIFVLTCNLYIKYFSHFKTTMLYYKPLEDSLVNKNYGQYILFCILK